MSDPERHRQDEPLPRTSGAANEPPGAEAPSPVLGVVPTAAGFSAPPVGFVAPAVVSVGDGPGCTYPGPGGGPSRLELLAWADGHPFGRIAPGVSLAVTRDGAPVLVAGSGADAAAGQRLPLQVGDRGRFRIGPMALDFRVLAPPRDPPRPALAPTPGMGPRCAACQGALPPGLELPQALVRCPRCGVWAEAPPATTGAAPRATPDLSRAPRVRIPTLPWIKRLRRAG